MKFSLFMMPLHHPTENPSLAFDRDIELIRYADDLGYDECFIGEHHSRNSGDTILILSIHVWPKRFSSSVMKSRCSL